MRIGIQKDTDDDGTDLHYGHVNPSVKPGDKVKKGDKIGVVDNSGRTTGPHVHYEARDRPYSEGGKHYGPTSEFNIQTSKKPCG